MNLKEEQIERYSRNIMLKDVGKKGQEKILNSKILVIGAGGLGSPALFYLAAAGTGTLGIVDSDNVDLSNLQRQIIHFTSDVKVSKVISAKEKIEKLNPDVKVVTYGDRINSKNIKNIIKDYDFIIDATDNFPAKFLINDACVFENKPFSHGGILRFKGQTMTYVPEQSCYRCVFNDLPPIDAVSLSGQEGVLGVTAGMLGTIQAAEALKYILGIGELLINRLLIIDALDMNFRKIEFKKNNNCSICGNNPIITELKDYPKY